MNTTMMAPNVDDERRNAGGKWQRLSRIAALSLVGCAIMLMAFPSSDPSSVPRRKLGAGQCEGQCKDPAFKDAQYFDGDDILKPAKILDRLQQERQKYKKQLQKDYGNDIYFKMFEPLEEVGETGQTSTQHVSVGRNRIFADPSTLVKSEHPDEERPAWGKLVRKLQMKIIQMQLGLVEERLNAKAICLDDCAQENEEGSRRLKTEPSNGLYTKLIWATGGHSASAAHGNLFRESYTANMDRALTPILASVGLDFEARNYAMGGTDSAEEVALCMNSIFGRDFDFISWDYGMTDGSELWKMTMYAYKAAGISKIANSLSQPGNIPHRPAWFAIHQNPGNNQVVKWMQDLGMTTLAYNAEYMHDVIMQEVPDTMGLNAEQIRNTPPYVQYLKCDGKVEKGDPGCGDNKFNNSLCTKRKARTSWHPGWKYHALMGNLMAITMLDGLEDALQGLIDLEPEVEETKVADTKQRLTKQLQALDREEDKDYDNIFKQPIPEQLLPHLEKWWKDGNSDHLKDVDIEAFFKEPSFCHSAILPAEIRFQGLLTENFTHTGTIKDQIYDEGFSPSDIARVEKGGSNSYADSEGRMMLVKNDDGRQACEEYLNLDYKDYFFVSSVEGWQTLTLPNNSEKKHYTEFDAKKGKGWVVACLTRCSWGKCPKGDLKDHFGWKTPYVGSGKDARPMTEEEIVSSGKVEMTINGELVTEASDMHTCYTLKNKKGPVWQPNANGQYDIRVRVTGGTEYSYIRFSALILL